MLKLEPIKARLNLASGSTHSKWAHIDLLNNAPTDLAALVAEVERLRGAIETHERTGRRMSNNPHDRDLWEVLDA